MASIGGVSSGNMSSIYGSRNVISGLASGMDTEGMIENAVSGIKNRISALGKKRTTWEWKQSAYQGVIDKLAQFANKYTSYSSTTNLSSASFFNKAVSTTTGGSNASKISATGKTSSDVLINAVKSLATAARGVSVGGALATGGTGNASATGESVDLAGKVEVSNIDGGMSFKYGTKSVSISFSEDEIVKSAGDLQQLITDKLKEQKITFDDGSTKNASEVIGVKLDGGKISIFDKSKGGNTVEISSANGNLAKTLGLQNAYKENPTEFSVDTGKLYSNVDRADQLKDKTLSFTLDGVTKKINLPSLKDANGGVVTAATYVENLQKELDTAFGKGKITVSNEQGKGADALTTKNLQLNFKLEEKGSTLQVNGEGSKALGLGSETTSYRNMSDTLGEIMQRGHGTRYALAEGTVTTDSEGNSFDSKGNQVKELRKDNGDLIPDKDGKAQYAKLAKDGKFQEEFDMVINGAKVGTFNRDTAMETVVASINNSTEAGVNVTYSKTTGNFTFTAKETGEANGIEFTKNADKSSGFAEQLFGKLRDVNDINGTPTNSLKTGTDAVFNVSINGESMDMTRSNNTFDVDGLSVTLKEAFNADKFTGEKLTGTVAAEDKVSFTTTSDTEKIIGAIKSMVEDYNVMMKEIKNQYGSMPLQKSNGSKYEPLTDEDKNSMSEDAVKAYEENARQGILFGDTDLSSLYNKMRGIFSASGTDGSFLRSIGIDTEYSNADGTTIKLDEEKLKTALENNPDAVKDAFTKTKDGGASTDGVMFNLKTQLDNYAGTTGATKGILIEKAGSKYAPTSLLKNSMKDATDNIDKEIERWQTKLSDSIDRYTGQFSRLEQLIAQMNSQSSALMGMMGGG